MAQQPPPNQQKTRQASGPQVPQPDNTPDADSKSALLRLVVVLGIVIGFFVYSYGWTVTDVNLENPLQDRRQATVTRALRELLSPNIFVQETELEEANAEILIGCETADAPEDNTVTGDAGLQMQLSTTCADENEELTVNISNASPLTQARLRWVPADGQTRPLRLSETNAEQFVIDGAGNYTATVEIPRVRGSEGQRSTVQLQVAVPSGNIQFSDTSNQVLQRMAETIFMALMATTIAIPIAALLSFFAARNLMKQVRLSVGTLLLAFVTFVGGCWLGSTIIADLGQMAVDVGAGNEFGTIGPAMAFVIPLLVLVGLIVFLRMSSSVKDDGKLKRKDVQTDDLQSIDVMAKTRSTLISLVTTLAVVFIAGAVGGLGLLGGEQISLLSENIRGDAESVSFLVIAVSTLIGSVGNMLSILGRLVELFMPVIAGLAGGFLLSGIAGNWFGAALRRIPDAPGRIIGLILGALSGALLMAGVARLGLWAALFGLLPPLIAGILGGQIFSQIYGSIIDPDKTRLKKRTSSERIINLAVFAIGFVLAFLATFELLNVRVSLISGLLPPDIPAVLFGAEMPFSTYVGRALLIGGILGGIGGGIAGSKATFPLGLTLYNVSRTTLNTVRSIEPLIMGLVFVIWVGIGPFAGVLALTLHSIAALGKLYSEQIENIDPGPLEALQSTGANQLQTIIYAVVPQIIPPYIAFTMYRWDINVRMSTIIGFVGGGGIGLLLQQQINLLRYRDAGVAVLAIAVVVSILDYASAAIRERLT